jgi:uncharacterized protein YjgD (DUF1641 family)
MSSTGWSSRANTRSSADALLEKLEDPRIVGALVSLLDKSDKLAVFADALETLLQHSEGMLESISRSVGQLGRAGTDSLKKGLESFNLDDLKSASGQVRDMLPLLQELVREFGLLKEAGFFDAAVVQVLGRTGRAMAAAARDPNAYATDTRGIFGLLGLLKDPEIARSLNFVISFARHFGGDTETGGSAGKNNRATGTGARYKSS